MRILSSALCWRILLSSLLVVGVLGVGLQRANAAHEQVDKKFERLVQHDLKLADLSEHLLATYVGEFFGEHSIFIHIISIAVVIAILMPIRQRVERAIEKFFEKKKVEF